MIRKLAILFALAFLIGTGKALAQCSNTAYGGFTCVQTAEAHSPSATSETATTSANVTSGDAIVGIAAAANATLSISASGAGCTGTFTVNTVITSGSLQVTQFRSTAASTGACSVKASSSGAAGIIEIRLWEWSGWNGTFDKIGTTATDGYVSSGTSMNCPNVSTTVNGDLVLCHMLNASAGDNTFTAGTNFAIVSQDATYGKAEEEDVQSSYGSITPAFKASTSNYYASGTMALEVGVPNAATPTFGLAAGTYTTSLPRSVTISTTAGGVICWNTTGSPLTNGSTGCTTGTLYSGAITLPVGTEMLYAMAGGTGYNNSAVASSAYTITPTLASLNGVTVGPTAGNISSLNGKWINPATGMVNSFNTLASPITAVAVSALIDFHGVTNGSTPTTTALGNSIYGETGDYTFVTSNGGAGLIASTASDLGLLLRPVNIGGTVYTGNGTLGLYCATTSSGKNCGVDQVSFSNAGTSFSVGFWWESNCPTVAFTDCGAQGGASSTSYLDYAVIHINGPSWRYSGIGFESKGTTSTTSIAYTPGNLYRINIQLNEGPSATNYLTVCSSTGALLGSLTATGSSTAYAPGAIEMGISGEEPTYVANYYWSNYVVSMTGLFSRTSCIL